MVTAFRLSPSGAFRSLRCLIYKVHIPHSRNRSIIAQRSSFVNCFFQLFSKFFFSSFHPSAPPQTALVEYHLLPELSTPFFNFFEKICWVVSRQISVLNCYFRCIDPLQKRCLRSCLISAHWFQKPKSLQNKNKSGTLMRTASCWRYLSSRAVASQVLWAEMSLTTVFGMGTGGPSS